MEKVLEESLLLDTYGQLLTEKQYDALDLHINQDLSLAEIAEQTGISRQGVYDNLKHGRQSLHDFESKLGIVGRFFNDNKSIETAIELLKQLSCSSENSDNAYRDSDSELIIQIRDILKGLLRE